MCILWFWCPHSGSLIFHCQRHSLSPTPVKHTAQPPGCPFLGPLLPKSFCGLQSNVGRLLPLLTLLLERALQESAVDGVIHIFILNLELSTLCLFSPLGLCLFHKQILKSHVRSCGLRNASVTGQKSRHLTSQEQRPGSVRGGRGLRPLREGRTQGSWAPTPIYFHLASLPSGSPAPRGLSSTQAELKSSHLGLPDCSCPCLTGYVTDLSTVGSNSLLFLLTSGSLFLPLPCNCSGS